nr:hypothetical protein KPHV_86970 [Kitasatospora purpeofusca]
MGSTRKLVETQRVALGAAEQRRQRRNKIITVCVSAAVALGMVAAVAWFVASEPKDPSHRATPALSADGDAAAAVPT